MSPVNYRNPVHEGYLADPYVLAWEGRYLAYGTGAMVDGLVFEILESDDLVSWHSIGGALRPVAEELGSTYWAPEVVASGGRFWMYYSVGVEDAGHHLRVASADSPRGPFLDEGVDLSPDEPFAIDPHAFCDVDGTWYLYYARDVLTGARPGTQLAVTVLATPTSTTGASRTVLAASADWQLFAADRDIYGSTYDWHTLEGPTVRRHDGRYYLTYSGGSWQGPGYAVAWAVADSPLGPWREPPAERGRLLASVPGHVRGPGHNSIVTLHGSATDVLVYHAWDAAVERRQLCIDPLEWDEDGPLTPGPTWTTQVLY